MSEYKTLMDVHRVSSSRVIPIKWQKFTFGLQKIGIPVGCGPLPILSGNLPHISLEQFDHSNITQISVENSLFIAEDLGNVLRQNTFDKLEFKLVNCIVLGDLKSITGFAVALEDCYHSVDTDTEAIRNTEFYIPCDVCRHRVFSRLGNNIPWECSSNGLSWMARKPINKMLDNYA